MNSHVDKQEVKDLWHIWCIYQSALQQGICSRGPLPEPIGDLLPGGPLPEPQAADKLHRVP